ncbi:NADH-quinone oxidoreductase subunit L [Leptospira sp. GIMC2001]|uniref:NADH-quinone oxidoreductase subunit L n=1 Tax=Leptospira sp. GIMC2001 TaxID=1513297 RepID=UPI00234921A1|nr:NADH-quinone oxidoreductase subunit L [Leptospira sp. GIMC2001]WCL48190.1 NADH-quinone oxidoreductase subunit L [Leptospira sp. GIMC2001]
MLEIFYLVLIFPVLGFLFNAFLINRASSRVAGTIGTLAVFIPFLIALGAFFEFHPLERTAPHLFTILPWIRIGGFAVDFAYQVDQLSLYMTLIITGIGTLIHLYSIGYMKKDSGFNRFFVYLNLFIFSMLNLVLADNLVLTFLGWEGVGLCSYLLIGFDYEKESASNAGMKAFVVNRIGDVGFIIGMGLIYWYTGSLKYIDIIASIPLISEFQSVINWVAIAFFVASVGKSAQIPLYVWLPDAMAGPTPVSALIHAATMVTAGLFLIVRLNIIYINAESASLVIAWIGCLTALFAATIAIFQNDIKKILAYSTVSQLGYMFLALGVGSYVGGMFHLMTHAFFKALLFLGAGSVIYALHHEQNLRNMGGLYSYMRITFITFAIGTFAISGIPPLSGFFSKDLILEKVFIYPQGGMVLWLLGIFTALMTAFYMFRLLFLVFLSSTRITESNRSHIHESPMTMTIPLVLLSIGAIVSGFLQTPFFMGNIKLLDQYFQPILQSGMDLQARWAGSPMQSVHLDHSVEILLVAISIIAAVTGLLVAYRFFLSKAKILLEEKDYRGFANVLVNKYFVDEFYDRFFVQNYLKLSRWVAFTFDSKIIDRFFMGIGHSLMGIGSFLRKFQTGFVGDYALYIVVGTILALAFVLVKGV